MRERRPDPGPQFVFLHGMRIRTGTNFLARVVGHHPDVRIVPPEGPTNEFHLLVTLPEWERVFERVRRRLFGRHPSPTWSEFEERLGKAWMELIADHYDLDGGVVFLKDPHVVRIEEFFDIFPRAKLILLVRDGRDNVASSVRAGLLTRRSMSRGARTRRRIQHWLLHDFVNHSRNWAWAARQVLDFDARHRTGERAGQYLLLRYEDMVEDPRQQGRRLFEFLGVEPREEVLARIPATRVVGSSFYGTSEGEDATTRTWDPIEKTAAFRPVGRWKSWGQVRKWTFKRLAGRELVALGYAEDLAW